jgi:hypothetical protein
MDFKTVATLGALLSGLFGVGFVLAPAVSQAFYGATNTDPFTLLLGRYFGTEMLLFCAALWALREVSDARVQRRAALGISLGSVCGLLVTSLGLGNGSLNAMGWSSAFIYLGFALAWGRLAMTMGSADVAAPRPQL